MCQLPGKPTQEWEQCHIQFDGGRNDGFVKSQSGPLDAGFLPASARLPSSSAVIAALDSPANRIGFPPEAA